MASTTLMPLDPALSPQRITRVLSIHANLMPDDVVAARRARSRRTWVIVALAIVVALMGGWYLVAVHDLNVATDDLGEATAAATREQKQQLAHEDVVLVQRQTTGLDAQLKALMGSDLPFDTLLDTVHSTGVSAGVKVTGVAATLDTQTAGGPAQQKLELPTTSGRTVGSVTITGTAPDKSSVAKFVDRLSALTIVVNPYLTNATRNEGDKLWTFSVAVDISSTALCGRFTTTCTGGK